MTVVDTRPEPAGALPAARQGGRHPGAGRPCDHRHQGAPQGPRGRGAARSATGGSRVRRRGIACDRRGGVGRLEPDHPSAIAIARAAALRRGARNLPARPARSRPSARPAPATAPSRSRACLREGARAGVEAAEAAGFAAELPELPAIDEPAEQPAQPLWQVPGKGKAFVDLQNDVTAADIGLALREGYRSVEHVKRYTTTGMGTDQGKTSNVNALGIIAAIDRPEHPRDRRHDLPPALYAGDLRRDRRAQLRRAVRSGAAHADARLARGARCGVRGRRPVEAALVLPAGPARPWPRRSTARSGRRAAASVILDASTLGKIDLQGPRRRGASEPRLHQRLEQARDRPLPLRPDAGRGRHGVRRRRHDAPGRAPLPDEHHVRRRGARARLARGVAADRVAGAAGLLHLGHRAVGDDQPVRPRLPQAAGRARARRRPRPGGLPAHERARGPGAGRAGADLPDQLHGRARLRDPGAGELRPAPVGALHGGRRKATASRPTAPRRCTCCAPRRATSSRARTPTAR